MFMEQNGKIINTPPQTCSTLVKAHVQDVGEDAQKHDRSFESEFGFGNDLLYPITFAALTQKNILFIKMFKFIQIFFNSQEFVKEPIEF